MVRFEVKHAINDKVFVADANGVDEAIIREIKLSGPNYAVDYKVERIKQNDSYDSPLDALHRIFLTPLGEGWLDSRCIFTDREQAMTSHELQKVIMEAKERSDARGLLLHRRIHLLEELEEVESELTEESLHI